MKGQIAFATSLYSLVQAQGLIDLSCIPVYSSLKYLGPTYLMLSASNAATQASSATSIVPTSNMAGSFWRVIWRPLDRVGIFRADVIRPQDNSR